MLLIQKTLKGMCLVDQAGEKKTETYTNIAKHGKYYFCKDSFDIYHIIEQNGNMPFKVDFDLCMFMPSVGIVKLRYDSNTPAIYMDVHNGNIYSCGQVKKLVDIANSSKNVLNLKKSDFLDSHFEQKVYDVLKKKWKFIVSKATTAEEKQVKQLQCEQARAAYKKYKYLVLNRPPKTTNSDVDIDDQNQK